MSITHAKVAADPEVPLLDDADWNAAHVGAPTLAEVLAAGHFAPAIQMNSDDVGETGPYGGYVVVTSAPGAIGRISGGTASDAAGNAGGAQVEARAGDESGNGGDVALIPGTGSGGRNGLVFANLPTSDPAVAGALWSNAGVVMVSSG